MRLVPFWTAFRRATVMLTMATILLGGGSVANRLAVCARLYRERARRFRQIEMDLLAHERRWQEMEACEHAAAAKFRQGEWGRGEDKYKAEFENIIKTIKGPNSEAIAAKLRRTHYESMARSCDESAEAAHETATCFGRKAEHFAALRRKYEEAASAPWWTVAPDPPEPK